MIDEPVTDDQEKPEVPESNFLTETDPYDLGQTHAEQTYAKPSVNKYYGSGSEEGVIGSAADAIKGMYYAGRKDIHNSLNWLTQHDAIDHNLLFGNAPSQDTNAADEAKSTFNFNQRMQDGLLNIESNNPNPVVYAGTQFGAQVGLFIAANALTAGTASILGAVGEGTATSFEALAARSAASLAEGGEASAAEEVPLAKTGLDGEIHFNIDDPSMAKSGAVSGFIRSAAVPAIPMIPFDMGANVSYDKYGHASIDGPQFVKDTALNFATNAVFEGVGAAYRSLISKDTTAAIAGEKTDELWDDIKPEDHEVEVLKTEAPLPSVRKESQPLANAESQESTTTAELIKKSFTDDQVNKILDNAIKPKLKSSKVHIDIKRTDEGAVEHNRFMSEDLTGSSRQKLNQALLSKLGVMYNGKNVSLDNPLIASEISGDMRQIRTYWLESGKRKVVLTDAFNKSKPSAEVNAIAKKLFVARPYTSTGAKRLKDTDYEAFSANTEGLNANYPIWYAQLKSGELDGSAAKRLLELANSGDEGAKLLKGLREESAIKKVDRDRMALLNDIDDAIDNHMTPEQYHSVIKDAYDRKGMFAKVEFDAEADKMVNDIFEDLKDNESKFYEDKDQNAFFTQVLKKMGKNEKAAQSYVNCLLGV